MDRNKSRGRSNKTEGKRASSGRPSSSDDRPKRTRGGAKGASSGYKKESDTYPKKKSGFDKFYKNKVSKHEEELDTKEFDKPLPKKNLPKKSTGPKKKADDGLIRLNKYLAHSGVCSRREADTYIEAGVVRVNGEVVTEMGHKVKPTDKVQFEDQTLQREKLVYLLMNKPKGFITTMDDPYERKTVMSLIENAVEERV